MLLNGDVFIYKLSKWQQTIESITKQHAKKVVSDRPWLVDFAIRLVNSVFLRNSNNRRTVKSILLVKKFLGLVEMTSGLTNASFTL